MSYNLKTYIDFEGDSSIDYVEVSLPYACIPNSSYNISEKNNQLNVILDLSTNVVYSYTFPSGNYTTATFMQVWPNVVDSSLLITYNATTGRFTVSSNAAKNFEFLPSTIDYVIGFSGLTSSVSFSLVMPRSVDFLPEPVYNICCPEINCGQALANGGTFQFSNILATIPNSGKFNVQTVYQNVGQDFVLKTSSYNQITIQILSDEGVYIDFNGLASFFALTFKIHRKVARMNATFFDLVKKSSRLNYLASQEDE